MVKFLFSASLLAGFLACGSPDTVTSSPDKKLPHPVERTDTTEVTLYYPGEDLLLHSVTRSLTLPEGQDETLKTIAKALVEGEGPEAPLVNPFPSDSRVLSLWVGPGDIVVNLDGSFRDKMPSTGSGVLMGQALSATLAKAATGDPLVHILLGGRTPQNVGGLDWRLPWVPKEGWIAH